jgi:hypothetical protein
LPGRVACDLARLVGDPPFDEKGLPMEMVHVAVV